LKAIEPEWESRESGKDTVQWFLWPICMTNAEYTAWFVMEILDVSRKERNYFGHSTFSFW